MMNLSDIIFEMHLILPLQFDEELFASKQISLSFFIKNQFLLLLRDFHFKKSFNNQKLSFLI